MAQQQAFETEAQQLDMEEVLAMKAAPAVMLKNVEVGVAVVLAEADALTADLKHFDPAAVHGVQVLAALVSAAASAVNARLLAAHDGLDEKLARMWTLRGYLLKQAEALAAAKVLKASEVARIRAGTGGYDAARDLSSLHALFTKEQAALRNRTPVTKTELDEAAALGTELQATLSPKGAKKATSTELRAARERRDRLFTLLERQWAWLWRLAAYALGPDGVDAFPALQASARRSAKKAPGSPAKAPA